LPQWEQVNFCVFTVAVCQSLSSIVLPVSVSLDVEGQRTSKLLIATPAFAFGRRGGSKKNLVAMSESINDASFGSVVGRHLHFHSIPNREANETLPHLSGNVCENEMIVRERDAKHGSGEHRHDGALQLDGFFRIHDFDLGNVANSAAPKVFGAGCEINMDLPAIACKRALSAAAERTRPLFARTRFVNS